MCTHTALVVRYPVQSGRIVSDHARRWNTANLEGKEIVGRNDCDGASHPWLDSDLHGLALYELLIGELKAFLMSSALRGDMKDSRYSRNSTGTYHCP